MWHFTNTYKCKNCKAYIRFNEDPSDDSCPVCHKGALWRQVNEDGIFVDYDPKRHIKED